VQYYPIEPRGICDRERKETLKETVTRTAVLGRTSRVNSAIEEGARMWNESTSRQKKTRRDRRPAHHQAESRALQEAPDCKL